MKKHNKYALLALKAMERAAAKVAEDARKNNYKIPVWKNGCIEYEIPGLITEPGAQADRQQHSDFSSLFNIRVSECCNEHRYRRIDIRSHGSHRVAHRSRVVTLSGLNKIQISSFRLGSDHLSPEHRCHVPKSYVTSHRPIVRLNRIPAPIHRLIDRETGERFWIRESEIEA